MQRLLSRRFASGRARARLVIAATTTAALLLPAGLLAAPAQASDVISQFALTEPAQVTLNNGELLACTDLNQDSGIAFEPIPEDVSMPSVWQGDQQEKAFQWGLERGCDEGTGPFKAVAVYATKGIGTFKVTNYTDAGSADDAEPIDVTQQLGSFARWQAGVDGINADNRPVYLVVKASKVKRKYKSLTEFYNFRVK